MILSYCFSFQSQKIINDHIEHRRQERYQNPDRFNVKPTLGEQCVRRPPPQPTQPTFEDSTLADSALHSQANPEGNLNGQSEIFSFFLGGLTIGIYLLILFTVKPA
jgi:hypothetical protein